jgi:hypothetical protein
VSIIRRYSCRFIRHNTVVREYSVATRSYLAALKRFEALAQKDGIVWTDKSVTIEQSRGTATKGLWR